MGRHYKNEIFNRTKVQKIARKFGDKYGKKSMDTATKTGMGTAKIASKRVVQKTAEATGDLIAKKIAE